MRKFKYILCIPFFIILSVINNLLEFFAEIFFIIAGIFNDEIMEETYRDYLEKD